jgi:cell division initiation protein
VKITPLDIRRKEFRRSVRGYSDEEVDIFLDEVADEFERLFQANIDLQDRAHRLEQQAVGHAQVKEALEKTLITAQLQSEEMRTNARKESELILRDAELKARGIIGESYGETQRVQQTLVQLKLLEEDFRSKFRSLLEGYLKLLDEAPLSAVTEEAAGKETPTATEAAVASPVTLVADEVPGAAPDVPTVPEEPPAVYQQDEVPTEETEAGVAHVNAAVDAYAAASTAPVLGRDSAEEATAEAETPARLNLAEIQEEETPRQGFFFGRHIDDFDGTFPPDDAVKKDKARDFEW